jgi:Tfp pilus assembly PilM family ATPase
MRFVTRFSPVGLHFGSLDTRLLQLTGSPRGWTVQAAEVAPAQGVTRHSQAATALSTCIKGHILGKDTAISTSAAGAALTVVPIERSQTDRLRATLEEAAARAIEDPEGINYRFLPLSRTLQDANERDEYLLLCLGESEQRRCTAASEALGLRPVGLEIAAFPVARTLTYATRNEKEAVGFLHLGFDHAYFGIAFDNEMRFLKPMERSGADLLDSLHQSAEPLEDVHSAQAMALGFLTDSDPAGAGHEDDAAMSASNASTMLAHVRRQSEESQGAAMMRALRVQGANLGQEIRACLRHFHARNPGIAVSQVAISGFGGGLPGITGVLEQALKIDVELAQPFTQIGIGAPAELLREQHLWCAPLGLALRNAA